MKTALVLVTFIDTNKGIRYEAGKVYEFETAMYNLLLSYRMIKPATAPAPTTTVAPTTTQAPNPAPTTTQTPATTTVAPNGDK